MGSREYPDTPPSLDHLGRTSGIKIAFHTDQLSHPAKQALYTIVQSGLNGYHNTLTYYAIDQRTTADREYLTARIRNRIEN